MLAPKKMKHQKWQRGRSKGVESRATQLNFGNFGLKALGKTWIKAVQMEAIRLIIVRSLKKKGQFWFRIFPDKPVTTKGTEVGMGGGKGSVSHYVFPIKPGRIIFELDGIKEELARQICTKAAAKLQIKTKFVKR